MREFGVAPPNVGVMFDFQQMYHVGVRVTDLDAAMAEYSAALDVEWATVQHSNSRGLWTPERGVHTAELTFVYSKGGPQHIELLQGGSIWDCNGQPGLHHVGVWSQDVGADVDAYLAAGWSLLAATKAPEDGYGTFAYVQPPSGLIVELVAVAAKPRFDAWFAGGLMGQERA